MNTANAITLIYDILKLDVNDKTKLELITNIDKVLSLDLTIKKSSSNSINEEEILKKIEERRIAKENKDYATADQIRNDLLNIGVVLKDTREGTTYEIQ